ncbi:glycosyltransferase [Granulicella sp. dw_53]|uniref:glycosyltransferase family 2 protein n=1 Tax=Granulicella sp. dw_53 TaxID=2719792 RepID=UPI001BD2F164|nr:glycosyltransferase [Granulicella sp. dw_53]
MAEPFFNYVITIHNKEELIHDVLVSVLLCCGPQSKIFAVLDGCTDDTEAILDEFIQKYQGVPLVKLYAPDVHEILSINTGLRAASQEGDGYNIILQDDVILADLNLEAKIKQLYEWGKGTLGFVSFRMGANFAPDARSSAVSTPIIKLIENAYGHGLPDAEILLPGRFAYRTVPVKSPVCVPTKIVREVGFMNENLAPYMHDDTDLAIRTTIAGYANGVFALRYYSEVKWGGTRTNPHSELPKMAIRNMNRIREQYGPDLQRIAQSVQRDDVVAFPDMCSDDLDHQAILQYEKTRGLSSQRYASVSNKIRTGLRRILPELSKAKQ